MVCSRHDSKQSRRCAGAERKNSKHRIPSGASHGSSVGTRIGAPVGCEFEMQNRFNKIQNYIPAIVLIQSRKAGTNEKTVGILALHTRRMQFSYTATLWNASIDRPTGK